MVVRITPEMNQKLEELKKDMHSKIKDAYKVREEKEAKAEELYEESHKLQVEAINEYRKAVQSARDEFTKAQYELILNEVKDEKEKAKEDNVHKNNKTVHKPFINDPFMNLLYDILTYDVVHKDEKEEIMQQRKWKEEEANLYPKHKSSRDYLAANMWELIEQLCEQNPKLDYWLPECMYRTDEEEEELKNVK